MLFKFTCFTCAFRNIALFIAFLLSPGIFIAFWIGDRASPWDMLPVWLKISIVLSSICAPIQLYRILTLRSKGKLR